MGSPKSHIIHNIINWFSIIYNNFSALLVLPEISTISRCFGNNPSKNDYNSHQISIRDSFYLHLRLDTDGPFPYFCSWCTFLAFLNNEIQLQFSVFFGLKQLSTISYIIMFIINNCKESIISLFMFYTEKNKIQKWHV